MSFKDIQKLEDSTQKGVSSEPRFSNKLIEEYFNEQERRNNFKTRPFEIFYEDVISSTLALDFNNLLGEPYYFNAGRDALCCLTICNNFRTISPYAINGWLHNALKFIDHIILHYIQEYLQEKPKKYANYGQEKSRYKQISESIKHKEASEAGYVLINLYESRNKLEHRTKINSDGTQEIIRPKYSLFQREVKKYYPSVLSKILNTYKEIKKEQENPNR